MAIASLVLLAPAVALAATAGLARADDARAPTTPMESVTESSVEAAIGSSMPTESTTPVTDTSGVPTTADTVPTTAETVSTTAETVPTTSETMPATTVDTVPTTDELAASAPPPSPDQSSAGPVANGAGARPAAVSAGSTARPSVVVPAALPAAPAVAPSVLASTGAPVIAPAIVPSAGPALGVGQPAIGPVQRPEIIPNVFTIAEQVAQWKMLLVIVTMSGIGAAALLHLGRRDQAVMDAIHLDLMLGIERGRPELLEHLDRP